MIARIKGIRQTVDVCSIRLPRAGSSNMIELFVYDNRYEKYRMIAVDSLDDIKFINEEEL